jgi:CheY-like chemotaxis protein
MDVRMPVVDGLKAAWHVLSTMARPPRIVVVTPFERRILVRSAAVVASGFLL